MRDGRRGPRGWPRVLTFVAAALVSAPIINAKASSFEVLKTFRSNRAKPNPLCVGSDEVLYGTTQDGGDHARGEVFSLDLHGTFKRLHSFDGSDGATPLAGLVEAGDGSFYGTTSAGAASYGTVFKIDKEGNFANIHSLSPSDGNAPASALVVGSDGALYGRTSWGGAGGAGTLFRVELDGSFTVVRSFTSTEGVPETMFRASDGALYGITKTSPWDAGYGTMFKIAAGGNVTTIHVFTGLDGGRPDGGFVQGVDGRFYGVAGIRVYTIDSLGALMVLHSYGDFPRMILASRAGGIYGTAGGGSGTGAQYAKLVKFDATGIYTVLHAFSQTDYEYPLSLTETNDGTLYGTAVLGDFGYVFRLDQGGTFTKLHTFVRSEGSKPDSELIVGGDGAFYGSTSQSDDTGGYGRVFRLDTSGVFDVVHDFTDNDGTSPAAIVTAPDGVVYGTTLGGGAPRGEGTVFRLDPDGTFTSLHSFAGADGTSPWKLIRGNDGTLYGTTSRGGPNSGTYGGGTVFRVSADASFATLHAFDGTDGASPRNLIQGSDGALYGGTVQAKGVVYRVTGDAAFALLHAFDGSDGSGPSTLLERAPGVFYGTTAGGGQNGDGTVFRVDSQGTFVSLHSFKGSDGCGPDYDAGLIRGQDGALYGTTDGCQLTAGTIFKVDARDHVVRFHLFDASTEGAEPVGLVSGPDGALYGTTRSGGAHGFGTVFRIDLHRQFAVLHSFEAERPGGPLIVGDDGALYGALDTYADDGGIFRVDRDGLFTMLHSFDGDRDGEGSYYPLIKGEDGKLYGSAPNGGPLSGGTVFRLAPYLGGDANGDFRLDVTDVFALIDFLFAGGPTPVPLLRADANGDGVVDVSDVFYLIEYLYAGGPPPA